MSSRIARLAARLDALSRPGLPAADDLQVTDWGDDLVILLPAEVVAALDLRAGDRIALSVPTQRSFNIEILRRGVVQPPPQPA
jgi:hypothetical protein